MYVFPWKTRGSSNPVPATCFSSCETGRPRSYTKGRRPETSAFSRSIASSGNDLRRGGGSLSLDLPPARDSRCAIRRRHVAPFSAKTLGCLSVSRRPGRRLLLSPNLSQQRRLGLAVCPLRDLGEVNWDSVSFVTSGLAKCLGTMNGTPRLYGPGTPWSRAISTLGLACRKRARGESRCFARQVCRTHAG